MFGKRDKKYRERIRICLNRYETMYLHGKSDHSDEEFWKFQLMAYNESYTIPLNKLNRWLGYIQGYLIAHGYTTVEAERNFTRPLFRPLDYPWWRISI